MGLHPQHLETAKAIEEQLISGILLRPKDFHSVAEIVTPDDFLKQELADIWRAFHSMAKSGIEFWRESVLSSELRKRGLIVRLGGDKAFANLLLKTTPGHAVYHSEELAKWAERRRVVVALELALQDASDLAFEPDEVINAAQSKLSRVKQSGSDEVEQIGKVMADYLEILEEARSNKTAAAVVPTGFEELDLALSGGIPLGSYAILAARPSIGKSALAMDIAWHAASSGNGSLFVSLEMTNHQISQRQFVKDANVRITEMQSASYTDQAVLAMLKACDNARELPLYVWQASGATIGRIESRIRAEIAKKQIKLVVVDYLGLIRGQDGRQSIYERVTMISNELARIAKQLNIALLVLCQLGRAAEGEVPSINNLRDSGAIEQDADIVMLLHRDKRDSKEARILLEKQRNGKIAQVNLSFDGKRFTDAFMNAKQFHGDFGNG
jgi:replicative DNA helicase